MSSTSLSYCVCPVCSREYHGFRSRDCLRDHLWEFSARCEKHLEQYTHCFPRARRCAKPQFSCTRCPRQFTRDSALKRHLETHDSKSYFCQCGRRFRQKRNVKEHLEKKRCRLFQMLQVGPHNLRADPLLTPRKPTGGRAEETTSQLSGPTVTTRSGETHSQQHAYTEHIEPEQNFDLSTLVQSNAHNLLANSNPSYSLSTVVDPLNNDCLAPFINCPPSNVIPQTFDLSTLVQGYHDASAYNLTENFDLSALVRPYEESILPTQSLLSTQTQAIFQG
ncbi:hypothetical protein BDV12DRAFT_172164 [Aspergillus spectabilis]